MPQINMTTPTLIGFDLGIVFTVAFLHFVGSSSLNTESWQHSSLKKLVLIELSYYLTSRLRQRSGTIRYKSRRLFRDQGQSPILGDRP